jgi:hypothetical protein
VPPHPHGHNPRQQDRRCTPYLLQLAGEQVPLLLEVLVGLAHPRLCLRQLSLGLPQAGRLLLHVPLQQPGEGQEGGEGEGGGSTPHHVQGSSGPCLHEPRAMESRIETRSVPGARTPTPLRIRSVQGGPPCVCSIRVEFAAYLSHVQCRLPVRQGLLSGRQVCSKDLQLLGLLCMTPGCSSGGGHQGSLGLGSGTT